MLVIASSPKERILLTAERLLAERGVDGVSLRQIGAESGNRNTSAVQYHFGSKGRLIQAIFDYRMPPLYERQQVLIAERRPDDLRSWVECYVLPILEQGEREGSHYFTFVAMLWQRRSRDGFANLPEEFRTSSRAFREHVGELLLHLPRPIRAHRTAQALGFSVHAAADRERARINRERILPFPLHVRDLIDGLVGFLAAPLSTEPAGRGA